MNHPCFGVSFEPGKLGCVSCTEAPRCEEEFCRRARITSQPVSTPDRRQTFIYCEKAPPRDVLEASGLVWSFSLKHEYERHVRFFKEPCYGGAHLIDGTYRIVPDDEFPYSFMLLMPRWQSDGLHQLDTSKRFEGYAPSVRCELCGGWIMETHISLLNDKRMQKKEVLFTTEQVLHPGPVNVEALKKLDMSKQPSYSMGARVPCYGKDCPVCRDHKTLIERDQEIHKNKKTKISAKDLDVGPDLDSLRMFDQDIRDCKNCHRGPYTFTITHYPGGEVVMHATFTNPQGGQFLVAEKRFAERALMCTPGLDVRVAWSEFIDSVAKGEAQPTGCESRFIHICEGPVRDCYFHNSDGTQTRDYKFCAAAVNRHKQKGNKIEMREDEWERFRHMVEPPADAVKKEAEKLGRQMAKSFEFALSYSRLPNRDGDTFEPESLKKAFQEWYEVQKGRAARLGDPVLLPTLEFEEMEKKILSSMQIPEKYFSGPKIEPIRKKQQGCPRTGKLCDATGQLTDRRDCIRCVWRPQKG